MLYLFLAAVLLLRCSPQYSATSVAVTIPDGYYIGTDRGIFNGYQVFVRVSGNTAIADCILIEKFARRLYTDTLAWDADNKAWTGKASGLAWKKGSWYLATRNHPIWMNTKIKLHSDEAYYLKTIDQKKNYASWRQVYEPYLMASKTPEAAKVLLRELGEKYELDKFMSYPHADFLQELEKFKSALKEN